MTFKINKQQLKKLDIWLQVQRLLAIEQQKLIHKGEYLYEDAWHLGFPYGDGLSYIFSTTGIGDVIKVKYHPNDNEIDLSEYEKW